MPVSILEALREEIEKKTHRQLQLDLGKVLISLVMLSNVLENIYQYTFRKATFITCLLHLIICPGWLIFPCRDLIPSPVVASPGQASATSHPSNASSHFHPLEL